jgi:hypothetical protein
MKESNNSISLKHHYFFKEICLSSIVLQPNNQIVLLKGLFQFDEMYFQTYLAVDYKLLNNMIRLTIDKNLASKLNAVIAEFLATEAFSCQIIEINLKEYFKNYLKLNEVYIFAASKKIPVEKVYNVSNYLPVSDIKLAYQ